MLIVFTPLDASLSFRKSQESWSVMDLAFPKKTLVYSLLWTFVSRLLKTETRMWNRPLWNRANDATGREDFRFWNCFFGWNGRDIQLPIDWRACLHELLPGRCHQNLFGVRNRLWRIRINLRLSFRRFVGWNQCISHLNDCDRRRNHLVLAWEDSTCVTCCQSDPQKQAYGWMVDNTKPNPSAHFVYSYME